MALRQQLDEATGFPLWRGEPVRENERLVLGPVPTEMVEQAVDEDGRFVLKGVSRAVLVRMLDRIDEDGETMVLAELVR